MPKKKLYQKTWFIVLMLLLVAPVGIFLMLVYTSWNRQAKTIVSIIALFFFIGVLASDAIISTEPPSSYLSESTSPQTAETPFTTHETSPAVADIQTPSPALSPSPSPVSDSEKIIATANDVFGTDNVISVEYTEASHYACIKAIGSDNLTAKMTVNGMFLDIAETLENLRDLVNVDIAFNIIYPLTDNYGNSTAETVIKATYNQDTRSKINWETFYFENIPDIADIWWMHAALNSVLD